MEIGPTILIVAVLIIAIWIIIELKRFKHKIFAILLIALILFTYVSFSVVLKNQGIDYKTVPGVISASKLYLSWLGSLFGNVKSVTAHVVKMDWVGNNTSTPKDNGKKPFGRIN